MKKDDKTRKKDAPHPPLKPGKPDARGAANDKNPEAQYENKDES